MASCPKCGSQVADGVKFCGACGWSTEAAVNAPATPPLSPSFSGQAPAGSAGGMASNVAAMLTYFPCLIGLVCSILFAFVLEPYKQDRFIRFHAWQSLAMHVVLVVFWIGWTFISLMLAAMSRAFAFITAPVSLLVSLGALVLMVILIIKAYGRQMFKVPVIGDWAEKQANR
jgi:uncharacterized membrane protein